MIVDDFRGFNFLPPAAHPVADIRRGYGLGTAATPDMGTASVAGAAVTIDPTATHGVVAKHLFRLDL